MARKNKGKAGGTTKMSPVVVVLIVAAVLGVGVIGFAVSSNSVGTAMATGPVILEGMEDPARLVELAQPMVLGDPSHPTKIIEFGDYQCPACRSFHQQVKPRIELAYLQTGMAQFVYFDFPLINAHPHAFLAARAARCAGDAGVEQYFEYHDALYMNQTAWSISSAPARLFVDYSRDLGLDTVEFEGCLRSDRHADVVSANLRLAEEMALPGTPSVLVQGPGQALPQRLSDSSFEAIAQALTLMKEGTP